MVSSESSEYPRYYEKEIETMDRERLETLQLERLKWQVKRCYESSEFYRERFDKIGLKPEDISSLDDVLKIPPVTKQELRDEQLSHPPFGRYVLAPQKDWRELHPSTGTTGVPVNTIWTENDVENIPSGQLEHFGISAPVPGISSKTALAMVCGWLVCPAIMRLRPWGASFCR